MTTLKDKLYDLVIMDILQEMFDIDPMDDQRKDISELLDEVLDEGQEEIV